MAKLSIPSGIPPASAVLDISTACSWWAIMSRRNPTSASLPDGFAARVPSA